MKKIAKVIICFLLITGLVYTPVMIPQLSNTPAVAVADAATVQLNKTDLKLYTQGTFKLKVTGTTKTVKWSSANSNIATVNENGFVTAKKIGQTKIKAKVGLKTYTCNVKVCYAPKMNWTAASVYAGGKTTLKVKNAIGPIKWTSSKPGVATVNSNGVVTGKVAGTTIITAKVKNKTTTCKITVKKRMTVNKTSVNFNKLSGSATVKVTFVAPGNWTITYNVQNTNVATCKWGQGWDGNTCNLYIYPEGEGTTYVNLTNSYNRQVVKIKVTVTDKLWNSDAIIDVLDAADDAGMYMGWANDDMKYYYDYDWGYSYKYDAIDELYDARSELATVKSIVAKKETVYCESGATLVQTANLAYDRCSDLIDIAYDVTEGDVLSYMDYLTVSAEVLTYVMEIQLAMLEMY